MQYGIVIGLGIFAGVLGAVLARAIGFESPFARAAMFAVLFVIVFGGYAWRRKSQTP